MNPRYIKSIARVVAVLMLLALLAGLTPGAVLPAYAAPGDLTRVSVDSSGAQANDRSFRSQLSADGRYVAFVSDATNLIPDDTNNAEDVFVKDRQTGATTRVSVASQTGAQANNGSEAVAISGDGRYVAFYSDASNLVSGDTNGLGDIFVHDRQTGLTIRVSVDSSGNEANGASYYSYVAISGDGRYVAFPSDATNLVSGDTNNARDIFVHDRQTSQTRRVSVDSNGAEANGSSGAVDISDDGRYVTYSSVATNLVAGDTNGTRDVFVYDLQMGTTTRVSVNTRGEEADGGGNVPAISGDGRYVVFLSDSSNLDTRADETGNKDLVYIYDRQIGQTTLASVYSEGRVMTVGLLDQPTISSNGRYVAFSFYDKGDNNGIMNIWVRDLLTGESIMVNYGNASSSSPSLSADGSIVAFSSGARNLISGDTNEVTDVFVREVVYGPDRNPTVASVTPDCGFSTPVCTYPTGASVSFIVIFSEPVTGVSVDDFSLDMLEGITGASITGVSGYGVEYFVTVATGTGDGKLRLNVVDDDSIKDMVLNPLGGAGAGNGNYTNLSNYFLYQIDRNNPTVTSIVRADSSPTAAAEVRFTVNFSEVVYPVGLSDFVLSTTGNISGAAVTAISPREDEYRARSMYTVTVNTGSGDGTLRLDIIDDDSILDNDKPFPPLGGEGAGNGDFTTGETYTINKSMPPSPPAITGILRTDPNPTNAASVNFTVNFSEPVSGVDSGDFSLTTTGSISGALVSNVSGSGNTYTVTVNTGSGDGDLRLDVINDDSIRSASGYSLGGPFTWGEAYTINKTIPSVISSLRADPNRTNAASVNFTVTFSEAVSGVDAGDFAPVAISNISGAVVTNVSGSGTAYTVTVNTGTGSGAVRLDILDNDSIVDATSNPLGGAGLGNGSFSSGETYIIDKDRPVVINILRTDATPTTANSVRFKVDFSDAVSGVDAGDFVLTTTGNISGSSISNIGSFANTYTITVTIGSGSGTLRLDLIDNGSIQDVALNPLRGAGTGNGSFTTGEVYTINIPPSNVLNVSYRSTGSGDGWVLESTENSNLGGSKNSTASTFMLGDDAQDRQYRTILHFPTYYLPDNAMVTRAILMIKKQNVVGTDPFTTHQNISIDIRNGLFDNFNLFKLGSLQPQDFQAPADMYAVGTITNNPVSDWYWATLDGRAFPYISLTGGTQLRLNFQLDDNDDMGEDYIRFYSGDYDGQKDRPHLLIEYYVPR